MIGPDVMLASSAGVEPGQALRQLSEAGWAWEVKWDGIRAVAHCQGGDITITNRRRADITARYPDVVAALSEQSFLGVIDGEIIVTADGKPSFELAHRRDAQQSLARVRHLAAATPATFMPFDVLALGDVDVRARPYLERRGLLEDVWEGPLPVSSTDGATLWDFVRQEGLEGLVAKNPASAYRPGRQRAWRKVKSTHRLTAIVGGLSPGVNGPIASLQLYLIDPTGAMRFIGQCGSGLSAAQLSRFAVRDLQRPTVVEVEYLEVSRAGMLRMPVFKGVRTDVPVQECTTTQLD